MTKLFGITLFTILTACQPTRMENVEVYYVPFGEETFVATTKENISNHCQICGPLRIDAEEVEKLQNIITETKSKKFDSNRVRLMIKFKNGKLLSVDNDGYVVDENNGFGKLSGSDLAKLKAVIESGDGS